MFQELMAKLKVAKNLLSSNPNIEDGNQISHENIERPKDLKGSDVLAIVREAANANDQVDCHTEQQMIENEQRTMKQAGRQLGINREQMTLQQKA